MPNQRDSRKKQFRLALANAEMTATEFARRQGVSPSHLYAVLDGRESQRLNAEIDAFIEKHSPQVAA